MPPQILLVRVVVSGSSLYVLGRKSTRHALRLPLNKGLRSQKASVVSTYGSISARHFLIDLQPANRHGHRERTMDSAKIRKFMQLAGQGVQQRLVSSDPKVRALGAQLLLSEVLEYVIRGLGVTPHINGAPLLDPEAVTYEPTNTPDPEEMVDGLADVAYTMYWNECAFGIPLKQAFELVCDNNLEKFVALPTWTGGERDLEKSEWDCSLGITWPPEVARVLVLKVDGEFFAVGKDARGKVRKPSSYRPVDLSKLVANS